MKLSREGFSALLFCRRRRQKRRKGVFGDTPNPGRASPAPLTSCQAKRAARGPFCLTYSSYWTPQAAKEGDLSSYRVEWLVRTFRGQVHLVSAKVEANQAL